MSSYEWPGLDDKRKVPAKREDTYTPEQDTHYLFKHTEQGKRLLEWLRETLDEPVVHQLGGGADYAPYREGQRSVYKLLLHMIDKAERTKS